MYDGDIFIFNLNMKRLVKKDYIDINLNFYLGQESEPLKIIFCMVEEGWLTVSLTSPVTRYHGNWKQVSFFAKKFLFEIVSYFCLYVYKCPVQLELLSELCLISVYMFTNVWSSRSCCLNCVLFLSLCLQMSSPVGTVV